MGYLKEVNIKYDMPTADLAVRRATYAIENGRTLGASAVKLIHGYGSSGRRRAGRYATTSRVSAFPSSTWRRGAPSPSATTSAATTTSKVPTTA